MKISLLVSSMLSLSLLSLITISSIAPELASKQAIFFILGLGLFILASKLNVTQLIHARWVWYVGLCALLVLTLLIGKDTRGSARWISVGGLFVIQASQLAVPVVSLLVSNMLKRAQKQSQVSLGQLMGAIVALVVPAILILIAPDLGTTLAFLASGGSIILFSPVKARHIMLLLLASLVVGILSWNYVLHDYQRQRIFSFVDSSDTSGSSYNARQALIAVGSGQIWGRGLGQGVQSHLRFLPERQTDFIFASYSEEFGFLGAVVLIGIYVALTATIIQTGMHARSEEERYFCLAIATMIAIQSTINIGMNIGLLPITGITLPLLSYGGSSILSICGTLGLIQAIDARKKQQGQLHLS